MKRAVAAATVALLLGACAGQPSAPDAAGVLRSAASAMAQLETVNATLKLTKGTISIQGFKLVSAKTAVRLPSDSDTTYTVKEQDVFIGLEVVILSGRVFLRVPFSGFQEITGPQAAEFPDMAKLFDRSTGLPAMIPDGSNPKYVSTDQVDGGDTYQIATSYTAGQVRSLLTALNASGSVAARIWVGTSDHLIRKATLDGAFGDGGTGAAVEVDISGFNSAVHISPPAP